MKSLEDIMAMAQNVQAELTKAQATLDTIEVEGVAGGGLVKIRATAKGRILGVELGIGRRRELTLRQLEIERHPDFAEMSGHGAVAHRCGDGG